MSHCLDNLRDVAAYCHFSYICVCMCIYVYVYVYTRIHKRAQTDTYMYMYLFVYYICICTYTVYSNIYTHTPSMQSYRNRGKKNYFTALEN